MICMPLFKKEIKSTWKMFLIFAAVLTMYITIIISMYDPQMGSLLAEFEEAMPGIMAAVGMSGAGNADLAGYTASYLFGFLMIVFPMIFSIIISNRVVAKYVDNGSMAYLLATPNTRLKIILTQGIFLAAAIGALVLFSAVLAILYSAAAFPGELDVGKYIYLSVGVYGLHIAISGLGFLASCISNDTKLSYALSAGIPIGFYVIQMIANQGDKYENLKYATFYTLFSPDYILAGNSIAVWMVLSLYLSGILLYTIGCIRFCKRNLAI